MSNLNASTWASGNCYSVDAALACTSAHIASIVDTRVIKACDIIETGSSFKGYIVSVNKEIHPAS